MFRYHLLGVRNELLVTPLAILVGLLVVVIVVLKIAKRAGKKISPTEEFIADSLDAEDTSGKIVDVLSAAAALVIVAMILWSWIR